MDVRVIAATNKDLKEEIRLQHFREDLYHRLGVIIVRVPSLRERTDDIPLLANHFMEIITAEMGKPLLSLQPDAIEALKLLNWTGNVRELRNMVERLAILCDRVVTRSDIEKYAN